MAEQEFRHMVRITRKDVDGNNSISSALTEIDGIGKAFSIAICKVLDLDQEEQIGYLDDDAVEKIEKVLEKPQEYGIPEWFLNRRNDYETGETKHLIEADLDMTVRDDINRMKKIRSYKGKRHEVGLPVRGQRTKSTFRHGSSVGVSRTKEVE